MSERVELEPTGEIVVCVCGNRPDLDGFFPCLSEGWSVEPTLDSKWENLYRCDRCGRIIDGSTGEVKGRAHEPPLDAYRLSFDLYLGNRNVGGLTRDELSMIIDALSDEITRTAPNGRTQDLFLRLVDLYEKTKTEVPR